MLHAPTAAFTSCAHISCTRASSLLYQLQQCCCRPWLLLQGRRSCCLAWVDSRSLLMLLAALLHLWCAYLAQCRLCCDGLRQEQACCWRQRRALHQRRLARCLLLC